MKEIVALSGGFYTGSSAINKFLSGSEFFCLPSQYDEFELVRAQGKGIANFTDSPEELVDNFVKYLSTDCFDFCKLLYRFLYKGDHDMVVTSEYQYVKSIIHFFWRVSTKGGFLAFLSQVHSFIKKIDVKKIDDKSNRWHSVFLRLSNILSRKNMPSYSVKGKFKTSTAIGNELLLKEARLFFDDILSTFTTKNKVLLACLIPGKFRNYRYTWDPEVVSLFFHNFFIRKLVFVTRDPRDSYCSYIKRATDYVKRGGVKSEQYAYSDEEAFKYLGTYLELHRQSLSLNTRKLVMRFEDFVLNHEKEVDRICDFLEISKENIDRSVYDINYSKSRIGLWKQYPNQDLMKYIASELKDYLYEA